MSEISISSDELLDCAIKTIKFDYRDNPNIVSKETWELIDTVKQMIEAVIR